MNIVLPSIKKYIAHPVVKGLFFVAALLPFFYFLFLFYYDLDQLGTLETRVEKLQKKAIAYHKSKEKEELFLSELKKADHFYLDNKIENVLFLDIEIKKLEALSLKEALPSSLKARLQFLKEGQNRLHFSEEAIRKSDKIQEVEEKQQHPVEMNEEDLKKLLCLIEAIPLSNYSPPEGRPQLIIKNFDLFKKETEGREKVYVVNMQLLKREYITE